MPNGISNNNLIKNVIPTKPIYWLDVNPRSI